MTVMRHDLLPDDRLLVWAPAPDSDDLCIHHVEVLEPSSYGDDYYLVRSLSSTDEWEMRLRPHNRALLMRTFVSEDASLKGVWARA